MLMSSHGALGIGNMVYNLPFDKILLDLSQTTHFLIKLKT
jgi:hypothetical protein